MKISGRKAIPNGLTNLRELQTSEHREDQHDADRQTPVTDAVHHKCFLSGVTGALFQSVIADQKIRAETDPLPADEHHQVVTAEDQRQHREHEEVEVREEAVKAVVFVHVADGVDVDKKSDS